MNRYEPRSYQSGSGVFATVMERATCGRYITYESHKQEIESLQARLDALQSKPKDSISISAIIAEHVEDALRKSIGETIHQFVGDILKAGLDKYNGDPCHGTVDSILAELAVSAGKTVKVDFDTYDAGKKSEQGFKSGRWQTGRAVFGKFSYANPINPVTDPFDKKVVCVSGDGRSFIAGAEYSYEVDSCEPGKDPDVIYICSDEFVSDLKGYSRWAANKSNNGSTIATYEVKNLIGSTCGVFQIK